MRLGVVGSRRCRARRGSLRTPVQRGIKKLAAGVQLEAGPVRRRGAGRPALTVSDPSLVEDLERRGGSDVAVAMVLEKSSVERMFSLNCRGEDWRRYTIAPGASARSSGVSEELCKGDRDDWSCLQLLPLIVITMRRSVIWMVPGSWVMLSRARSEASRERGDPMRSSGGRCRGCLAAGG